MGQIFRAISGSGFFTVLRFRKQIAVTPAGLLLALGEAGISQSQVPSQEVGAPAPDMALCLVSPKEVPRYHFIQTSKQLWGKGRAHSTASPLPPPLVRPCDRGGVWVVALPLPQPCGFRRWLAVPEPHFSLPESVASHGPLPGCRAVGRGRVHPGPRASISSHQHLLSSRVIIYRLEVAEPGSGRAGT